jgi:hypothetical protein
MFAIALLPLVGYFAFLTCLHFRRTPTVLNGSTDFMFLAWGLCGLITLGPGRLIIPLYVFAAWGVFTWFFWLGFYFVVVQTIAQKFRNRIVVYHCPRELVLPAFFTLARQIDPKTEWSGHVLSLHGLGMQWVVSHDKYGGHVQFIPTSPSNNPHREMLQEQLTNLCQTLVMPKRNIRWFWGILTFGLFCLVIGLLIRDFTNIVHLFKDYWLLF